MPELPEVQTTVSGLQKILPKQTITAVWTDLAVTKQRVPHFKDTLKDAVFYTRFKKEIVGASIISVTRRAKNILIHLNTGKTILIHMKMTGHVMIGRYTHDTKTNTWSVAPDEKNDALLDPYNRFIHVVLSLSNGQQMVLCDSRKFAKVTLLDTQTAHETPHLQGIGPEPLGEAMTEHMFSTRLQTKPNGKIKSVLLDQTIIAGIGNIYSDEMLWLAGIHPETMVKNISTKELRALFITMKKVLEKGIDFGGDSTSDYRDVYGRRGEFSHQHNAYRLTGRKCSKRGCNGVILRKVVGGRSAHYCSIHQIKK